MKAFKIMSAARLAGIWLLCAVFPRPKYWVFRRYKAHFNIVSSDFNVIEESFALHFVEPFSSRKKANEAIKTAKHLQPWQEFIVLS